MNKSLTRTRLILAIISTSIEEVGIWAIWRWLLPEFGILLPVWLLIVIMVAWAVFGTWLFIFTTWALKKQVPAGLPSMVGTVGKASGNLAPEGMVKIRGELWGAVSEEGDIADGESIIVTGENGLKLLVRKKQ